MKKCFIIASNTFREAVRDRVLYLFFVFAVVVIIVSKALGWVSVDRDAEIVGDISLLAISLFSVIIAVFVGTGLIYKEMDKRTIYTILSKPVDRWQFILGKYLGLAGTISLVALSMEIFFVAYLGVQGYLPEGEARRMLFYSLLLVHCEIMVITAVAIMFSLLTSPILSAVLTIIVWLSGNSAGELENLRQTFQDRFEDSGNAVFSTMAGLTHGVYVVTPHLNYFTELKRYAFWPDPVGMAALGVTEPGILYRVLYAVCYSAVLLCLSVIVFRRKSF